MGFFDPDGLREGWKGLSELRSKTPTRVRDTPITGGEPVGERPKRTAPGQAACAFGGSPGGESPRDWIHYDWFSWSGRSMGVSRLSCAPTGV